MFFDCMIRLKGSSLALETYTSLLTMKTPSLIYRILITVGVILSAPGPCFAETNGWRQLFNGTDNDCNSGVFIRIPEKPADEWAAVNTGYEVQIDNGVRHVGGEYHCSGVLYSLTKALAHPQRKPGEWNELEITLDGPRTIVMLNGQKVTD